MTRRARVGLTRVGCSSPRPAEHYDRFMGRYVPTLAAALVDAAELREVRRWRVLDVGGCGPGGLASGLAARVGVENVAAIDPAPQFVRACRDLATRAPTSARASPRRCPGLDGEFDAALSSARDRLHVRILRGASREMARVTRDGGTVAACMWDTYEPVA